MHAIDYAKAALVLTLGALLLGGGSASAQTLAAGESEGALLAASCSGCHGDTGTEPSAVAPLANLSGAEIRQALLAFREDRRPATVMNRLAKGYTLADIDRLAAYFDSARGKEQP